MKPEKALEKLKKLAKKTKGRDYVDLAQSHVEADRVLIDLIGELLREKKQRHLGEKIAKTFSEIKKWYE